MEELSRHWDHLFGEIRRLDQKIDALGSALSARIDALDQKFDRRFEAVDRQFTDLRDELSKQFRWTFSTIAGAVGHDADSWCWYGDSPFAELGPRRALDPIPSLIGAEVYNRLDMKTVGRRHGGSQRIGALQRTLSKLRGTGVLIPRGVFRFTSFEETDAWMTRTMARTHASRKSKISRGSAAR